MLLSAIYGIRILSILNYIAVPILLFVCIYGLVVSLNNGGLAVVENYKPAGSMSFMTGLAITIGSLRLVRLLLAIILSIRNRAKML